MTLEELALVRNSRPFVPVKLVMSDGRAYDIRHPEMITLGKTGSLIGVHDRYTDNGDVYAEYVIRVANDHITTAIPIAVADQVGQ